MTIGKLLRNYDVEKRHINRHNKIKTYYFYITMVLEHDHLPTCSTTTTKKKSMKIGPFVQELCLSTTESMKIGPPYKNHVFSTNENYKNRTIVQELCVDVQRKKKIQTNCIAFFVESRLKFIKYVNHKMD